MDSHEVSYAVVEDDGELDVEARVNGVLIGYARCVRAGDRLHLADVHVDEALPRGWPILPRLLRSLVGPRRPWPLRGRGIGTELLTRLLRRADAAGVREAWGTVTAADLAEWPGLLAWYERHGFVVGEPDAECLGDAAKKIVRRR